MNGLCLQQEELWKVLKNWEKGEFGTLKLLCIVFPDHQRSLVAVDCSRNFKGI